MAVWEMFQTDKEWEEYLKKLVKTNDKALFRAIVLIYDSQTEEEKYKQESVEENSVGFTKWDAKEMSAIAKKIKQGSQLDAGEMARSRNKMQKYWKQLMVISKRQMAEKAEAKRREQIEQQKEVFRQNLEVIRKCSEEGIACDYGICDECPLTQGYQMRLKLEV